MPGLAILEYFIRVKYGADAAYKALPYLLGLAAAYSVFLVVRIVSLVRRQPKRVKATGERREYVKASIIGVIWIVLTGAAPFQPWIEMGTWAILAWLLILAMLLVPQMIRNRRAYGTWTLKGAKQPAKRD